MISIILGAILISFASIFVKVVNVGPSAAVFYRFFFGGLALVILALLNRQKLLVPIKQLRWIALAGFAFSMDLFFWHRSIRMVGPGMATILANFQVFILAGIGIFYFKEPLTRSFKLAVPLAFAGLLMIIGVDWSTLTIDYQLGLVYGLITSVWYAIFTLSLKKAGSLKDSLSPMVNMAWAFFIGTLAALIQVSAVGESLAIPDLKTWLLLIAYGVVCSSIGWGLIMRGLPKVHASRAGLILVLQPTFAFIWDILIFNRPTTILEITGALVTLAGIYLGTKSS